MWKSDALFEKFYVNSFWMGHDTQHFHRITGFQQELQNPKVKFRNL